MIGRDELAGMGEDEVLAAAGLRAARIREDEADLLRLAYQMAMINNPERLDPSSTDKPGHEKTRQYGGDGTPQVTEFAAAAFGARVAMTTFAAGQLMADALDLVHRSPRLWARVEAGEVRASYARYVVKHLRLARPPRRPLPGRPHRHPLDPQGRRRPAAGRRDLPRPPRDQTRLGSRLSR